MTDSTNIREVQTVTIMGAGNVAWHLGYHLKRAGIKILEVYNRTPERGEMLARELNSKYIQEYASLDKTADLVVVSVSDDAILEIAQSGCLMDYKLVVHTAGGVDINVFEGNAENYGVLYPVQTFTLGKPVDFTHIPILTEGNIAGISATIRNLALKLSKNVHEMSSENRIFLHMTAVIASNFPNHLFALSEQLLREKNLPFDLLKPLIQETIQKAMELSPERAQTGPAARRNTAVIAKHLRMLERYPDIGRIYKDLSDSIMKFGKPSDS